MQNTKTIISLKSIFAKYFTRIGGGDPTPL